MSNYNVRMGRLSVDTTRLLRQRAAAAEKPEYRALAARVIAAFDEAKTIRFSESKKYNAAILAEWRRIATVDATSCHEKGSD